MSLTTRNFVKKAYRAALLRDPTPQELARSRSSLNVSYSVGGSALLNDAKSRLKALFLLSEYTTRSTSDDVFITDVFGAYLDRLPSGADLTFYEDYLDTPYTRAEMLDAVGLAPEFEDRVDTLVPCGPFPTADQGGSTAIKILEIPPNHDAAMILHEYADGGVSVDTRSDISTREWEVDYDGLDEDEAQVYDEHREDARGQAYGFTFIDRQGVTWTGVRYAQGGFNADHTKTCVQARKAHLIFRP